MLCYENGAAREKRACKSGKHQCKISVAYVYSIVSIGVKAQLQSIPCSRIPPVVKLPTPAQRVMGISYKCSNSNVTPFASLSHKSSTRPRMW